MSLPLLLAVTDVHERLQAVTWFMLEPDYIVVCTAMPVRSRCGCWS